MPSDYYGPKKSVVGDSSLNGSNWTPPKFLGNTRGASEVPRASSLQSNTSVNKEQANVPPQSIRQSESFRQQISDAEMQRKREGGLCFRCEEKWRFGHVCKNPQLQVFIAAVDEDDGAGANVTVEEAPGRQTAEHRGVT